MHRAVQEWNASWALVQEADASIEIKVSLKSRADIISVRHLSDTSWLWKDKMPAMEAFTKYFGQGVRVSQPCVALGLLFKQLVHHTRLTLVSC
eukprot:4990884-Amphidinium_carterae.1